MNGGQMTQLMHTGSDAGLVDARAQESARG
jgi:hypothetical protein